MTLIQRDFETGTNGADASGEFSSVILNSGTVTYSNTHPGDGSMGFACTQSGTGACYGVISTLNGATARTEFCFWFGGNPSATVRIYEFRTAAGLSFGVNLTSGGKLQLVNNAGTAIGTTTASLTGGNVVRVALRGTSHASAGTVMLTAYIGARNTTPFEATMSLTGQATRGGNITIGRGPGIVSTGNFGSVFYGDSYQADDTSTAEFGPYPLAIAGSAPDNQGLTDSVTFELVAAVSDALGGTDATTTQRTVAVVDSIGTTDVDQVETRDVDDTAADAEGLTDSATGALTMPRSTTDAEGLTDSAAGSLTMPRTAAETLGLTDTADGALSMARTASDDEGLTDTRTAALDQQTADTAGLTDTVSGTMAYGRAAADTAGLTDAVTFELVASTTDAIGLSDQTEAEQAGATDASHGDTAGLSDAVTFERSAVVTDSLGVTDSRAASETVSGAENDDLGLSDSVTHELSRAAATASTAGLSDAVTFELVASLSDTMGMTDTLELVSSFQRIIDESAGLGDQVRTEAAAARLDQLGLTDEAVGELVHVGTAPATLEVLAAHLRIPAARGQLRIPTARGQLRALEDAGRLR